MLTQALLKELFSYNEDSGEFIRLKLNGGQKVGTIAGSIDAYGYRVISIQKKKYKAHRLVWLYVHGIMPASIDHKDQDRLNNTISNLRDVSQAENCKNKSRQCNNTSGVTGVSFHKPSGKWQVRISVNKKETFLGQFDTMEEAIAIRNKAKQDNGYSKSHS